MNTRREGSITVFLSLIMLLVLSILMTTIEVARVSSFQVHTDRALVAAMDSVLADFYYPLYEEYHVFALEGSYGKGSNSISNQGTNAHVTSNIDKDKIASIATDYMEYTFVPDKNLKKDLHEVLEYAYVFDYFKLYGIKAKEVEVLDVTTLLDYEGEYFRTQAVDYMKYASVGKGLDFILDTLIPIKESKTTQSIAKEKQKTEDSLSTLEENILELMSYIDGIQIGVKGIVVGKDGYLDVKNSFVKKLCPYDVSMASTGINNEWIFASLKNAYLNPYININSQISSVNGLKYTMDRLLEVETDYRFCKLIDQDGIKDKGELKSLREKIKRLENEMEAYSKEEDRYVNYIKTENNNLKTLVSNTNTSIESALNVIDKVIEQQKLVNKNIDDYEIYLNGKKNELSEELFQNLIEDFSSLSKYKVSDYNANRALKNDFQRMKETLLANKRLLDSITQSLYIPITSSDSSATSYMNKLLSTKEQFGLYSFKDLSFDYSSMQKPMESESFFKKIKEVFQIGVIGLVLEDSSKLSKKEISSGILPSVILGIKETSDPVDITNIIKDSKVDSGQETFSNIFEGFNTNMNLDDFLNVTNDFSEALLYTAYLKEHFSNYNYESIEETSSALEYELEYILMGKKSDNQNMNGIIMKILLIRSMINLGTIMFHKETTLKASEIATLFLGFTGIPVLVSILKVLLLVIVSVVESLVDVAAMLKGKKLPFLKRGDQLQVSIEDLFVLSKSMIISKANKIQDTTNNLSFGYNEYLYLFLLLENNKNKSYRAMDLIQENIQINYEKTFYIKNCIQGFAINGTFEMDKKFIALTFVHKILQDVNEKFQYKTLKGYSY
jgi:hypothetical protein